MRMLSLDKEGHSNGPQQAACTGAAPTASASPHTSAALTTSAPILVSGSQKAMSLEDGEAFFSPPSRCTGNDSATSTSLDADDEADAGPPADTAELPSTPSSAPLYPAGHRWLVESHEGDSPLRRVDTMREEASTAAPHDAHASSQPPAGAAMDEEHKKDTAGADAAAAATVSTQSTAAAGRHASNLRRRRSAKPAGRSNSPSSRATGAGGNGNSSSSSDGTPTASPLVPRASRVSLSQPPSTFALSTVGGEAAEAGCVAATAPIVAPAARCISSEGEAGMNLSSSPPASPPSLTSAATARDFSDGSPASRNSDAFRSPLSTRLRLAPRLSAELQQFGCCVFFFPAPLVSWLFPLIGHVAISNAEGSRLFTFESSYYVREEKLVAVLDRVLREEMNSSSGALASPARRSRFGLDHLAHGDASEGAHSPSPAQSPLPLRNSALSDASASDAGLPSPSDGSALSPALRSASTPLFPARPPARPPRRTGRPKAAGGTVATGHTHTRCVRIWDLKPLLMESRGRRTKRAPYSITREGGRQAAVALWERLQELLQAADGTTGSSFAGKGEARSPPMSRTCGRTGTEPRGGVAEGAHSTTSGSSSGDEDDEFELLDTETAHFYNRNLNATIRLFRGSADGSNNSPDVVLQHHSSFSFVGFVLEACGVGSQAKLSTPAPVPARSGPANSEGGAGNSSSGAAAVAESGDTDEEIHWGLVKLLFHVFIFGKWHRGEGRLRRALHGGSITSAAILWIIVLAVGLHYFRLMFA